MKKLFYLLILSIMIIPISVNADNNLAEIHNLISKDNNLEVKSIPIEFYKNSLFFKECMGETNDSFFEESCLNYTYSIVVESYLNKTVKVPENTRFWVSDCDFKKNTCKISVSNSENTVGKDYDIKFISTYDEKVYKKSEQVVQNIKKNYYLSDLSYINQLINYQNEAGYHSDIIYNNYKIFKIFPELKNELEKNKHYKYVPVTLGVGAGPHLYGSGGAVVIYDNDVAVNISSQLGYNTLRIVYVPNTTPNTDEEYIKTALDRIKDYVNNDSYNIKLEKDEQYVNNIIGGDTNIIDVSREFNYIFKDDKKYESKFYKLTINETEYLLGVLPLPKGLINKLNVKSTNYQTGINVETESSDVPLDTSVEVEDVSHKHKDFLKAYDIDLYSEIKEEYITKVKDGIIVRIPMEDDYDKEEVDVFYVKEDGQKGEKYKAKIKTIDGKKYAEFTTDHFSTYAIKNEEEKQISEEIENPNTYDGICDSLFRGMISIIGLIITIICFKKTDKIEV